MLRRQSSIGLQYLQQACSAGGLDAALETLPAIAYRLPACNAAHALTQARGTASSSGPSGPAASSSRAAAAASTTTSGSGNETPLAFFARQQQTLAAMPMYPKMLGFAGAIPFVTLAPAMVTSAGFPDLVDYCAQMQLVYGGSVVSFLGAVHWGLAMSGATTAAAGSKASQALNEHYVWSVVPSLGAVSALMMQPAQGSLAISVLLGICYLSDASYFRAGYIPSWYMGLRGYLTLLAIVGMLATTSYYLKRDIEKAQKLIQEEDAKRVARLEARTMNASLAAASLDGTDEAPAPARAQPAGRK